MNKYKALIASALIGLVLAVLWPGGMPSEFAPTGVTADALSTYSRASSDVSFPSAPLVFYAVLLLSLIAGRLRVTQLHPNGGKWVLTFGFFWLVFGAAFKLLGAPFITGDSLVYLRQPDTPWQAFGAHHPSGSMWVFWLGAHLGLPIAATLTALGALEAVVLYRLLSIRGRFCLSAAIVLLTFMYPDNLLLRMSLWSEPILFAGILVACLALVSSSIPSWALVSSFVLLFLALCEVRHATIFLLPGFVLGLAGYVSRGRLLRFAVYGGCLGALFVGAWFALNFLRTGVVTSTSRGSFECVHFITAYHRIPFCSTSPSIPLCTADPTDSFLQQRSGVNPGFVDLFRFVFDVDSPLVRLGLSPQGSCDVWGDIRNDLIQHHKRQVLLLVLTRVLSQFGSWEVSERGAAISPPIYPGADALLDRVASAFNRHVEVLWIIWGISMLVGIKSRQLWSPVVVFLIVGAIGHGVGIAVNNPFLALRYLAVPKYMLSLASLLILFGATSREKIDSGDADGGSSSQRSELGKD